MKTLKGDEIGDENLNVEGEMFYFKLYKRHQICSLQNVMIDHLDLEVKNYKQV